MNNPTQPGLFDPEPAPEAPEPEPDPVEATETRKLIERLLDASERLLRLVHEHEPEREDKPAWVELRESSADVRDLLDRRLPLSDLKSNSGRVSNTHPETSRKSSRVVRAGTQRHHLLWLLHEAGERGLTSYEATEGMKKVRPEMSPNQTATRMGELRDDFGFVTRLERNGQLVTRQAARGDAEVYVLTSSGLRAIEQLGQP